MRLPPSRAHARGRIRRGAAGCDGILAPMAQDDIHLIGPDEIAYRLELTPAQLKITWNALHSMLDDFGHDDRDIHRIVREVLDKLPDEHSIRAIDISRR